MWPTAKPKLQLNFHMYLYLYIYIYIYICMYINHYITYIIYVHIHPLYLSYLGISRFVCVACACPGRVSSTTLRWELVVGLMIIGIFTINTYIYIYIIIYTILCIYIYINGIHIFIAKPFLDTPLSDTSRYQMVDCISIYIYTHIGGCVTLLYKYIYIYIHKYIYTYTHIYIHIFLLMIFIINTFWQPYESITNFTNNHVDR